MITFETKVYENDWEYILAGNYLSKLINKCNYTFNKKVLLINNVKDPKRLKKYADKKVKDGILDEYYLVEDFANEALNYFEIERASFKGGYFYSIAELVSIYLCTTDYLLHFSSDSFIQNDAGDWINNAIEIFKSRDDVIVANPTWNFAFQEAKIESIEELDGFYLAYGFSDQCYLIKSNIFRDKIYNETHIESERYPKYGGELFEKRVDSYMRTKKYYRLTSKNVSYIHINFNSGKLYRLINRISGGALVEKRFIKYGSNLNK